MIVERLSAKPVKDDLQGWLQYAADREQLAKDIAADETHPETTPAFYYDPNTLTFVYENERGPVATVRLSSTLRLHAQFSAGASKLEVAEVLRSQFPLVAKRAKMNGYRQIVFSSVSGQLKAFFRRYLKFRPSPDEHVIEL